MQSDNKSMAYVLMPYYRTRQDLFEKSIHSFIQQNYQNKKLIIYIDDKIDQKESILNFLNNSEKRDIIIIGGIEHKGVATARNELLKYVKNNVDDNSFIFQLDSDDQYMKNDSISNAINLMQNANTDIGILEFSYGFYDGKTKNDDLLKTEIETKDLVKKYQKSKYFELDDLTKMTSLGCVKIYNSKTFKKFINVEENEKYFDFVYMGIFFSDKLKIIGISGNNVIFNRYNSSVTGHRKEKDCKDVINRLKEFADFAKSLNQNKDNEKYIKYFVDSKIEQYKKIFKIYDEENNTNLLNYFKELINN